MVFVNITSPWAKNDVTVTIAILPRDCFCCCFIFPPKIALTKIPEDIFFQELWCIGGLISKDSERAIVGHLEPPRFNVCLFGKCRKSSSTRIDKKPMLHFSLPFLNGSSYRSGIGLELKIILHTINRWNLITCWALSRPVWVLRSSQYCR